MPVISVIAALVIGGLRAAAPAPLPVPTYSTTRTVVTTVTTTAGQAVIYPFQRKVWKIGSKYWLFYAAGSPGVAGTLSYRTSSDAVTWSGATSVRSSALETAGHRWGTYYDGTYIHYVFGEGQTGSGAVYYRRGTPETNGTITWSAAEQTIYSEGGKGGAYVSVFADSTGNPWVGFMRYVDPAYGTPVQGRLYRSSTTDGTWVNDTGFPYDIAANYSFAPPPACVPLSAGKVYCAYPTDAAVGLQYGKLWDGDSWGDQETPVSINMASTNRNIVGDADLVHLATMSFVGGVFDIHYWRRSAGGTWSGAIRLTPSSFTPGTHLSMTLLDHDRVRVYWPHQNKIKYRDVHAGVALGSDVSELQDESTPTIANVLQPDSIPIASDPITVYTTKAATPWDLVSVRQVKR